MAGEGGQLVLELDKRHRRLAKEGGRKAPFFMVASTIKKSACLAPLFEIGNRLD